MLGALRRSATSALRGSLGSTPGNTTSGSITQAAAAARSWLSRAFADDASSEAKPEGEAAATSSSTAVEPAAEAGASSSDATGGEAAVAAPEAAGAAAVPHPAVPEWDDEPWDVPLEQLSKRQQAHLGANPEKYKHFLPKLRRKERGAFGEPEMVEEFAEEALYYPTLPENRPLYDLRTAVPEIMQPQAPLFDKLRTIQRAQPDMTPQEMAAAIGMHVQPPEPPFPGAEQILEWELRLVMAVGVNESHPLNKKAKCRLYLRDLQKQCGLADAALQHIAAVCGQRYDPRTGRLTLVSTRYPHREENRRHIVRIIKALVEEGHAKYPNTQQQGEQQEEQAHKAAAAASAQ